VDSLEDRARGVVDGVLRRVALREAAGVLQVWSGGDPERARVLLDEHLACGGREVEAARLVAIVNAEARPCEDPDWWD
jgi:hypothetical protein